MITQNELKRILDYNKETGIFTWLCDRGTNKVKNKIAGCIHSNGYIYISLNKRRYFAHRLAWLYVYGEWPSNQIDHINGVKDDNRIENLRDVIPRENSQNRKKHREGHIIGTTYSKLYKKWIAQIRIKGKVNRLGSFETQQEAHEVYLKAFEFLKENGEQATIEKYKKKSTKGYCYRKEKFKKIKKRIAFNKIINKWSLWVEVNKKRINLGIYETKELSYQTYLKFLEENNDMINVGGVEL